MEHREDQGERISVDCMSVEGMAAEQRDESLFRQRCRMIGTWIEGENGIAFCNSLSLAGRKVENAEHLKESKRFR